MKKHLFSLMAVVAMLLFAIPAKAQRVSVYVNYGGYTQMDAMNMHDDWKGVKTAWGAVTAGVDFKIGSKFRIGPSYSFSSTTTKGGKNASDIYYHVIMLNAKYDYYRTSIFSIYGHIGLGAEISHLCPKYLDDPYNKGYFAFQVSPVGMRAQLGKGFYFNAELGFGAQGLVQAGFGYDF